MIGPRVIAIAEVLGRVADSLRVDVPYAFAGIVVIILAVLPGLMLALGLGRRSRWDLPTVAVAAFSFGVALVAAVALAAHYLGLTLTVVLWAGLVLAVATSVAGFFLGRGRDWPEVRPQAVGIAAMAAVIGVIERPWMSWTSDTFYHLAAARSLLHFDRPLVTDPFFGTASRTLDPTSGVLHTLLALWSRVTGLDVLWFWPGALALSAAMVVLAFWALARRVSGSDRAATVATIAYLAFVFYFDFRQFPQPNRMSIALAFAAILGAVMLVAEPSREAFALTVGAAFATFSMHLASAAMVVVVLAALVVWAAVATVVRRLRTGRWRAGPLAALLGASFACAVAAVPVMLPKSTVVASSSLVDLASSRLSGSVVRLGGWLAVRPGGMVGGGVPLFWVVALLTVMAALVAFRDDEAEALAVAAIAGLPVLLLLNPLLATPLLKTSYYMTARVAELLRFTPFVAIGWALARPAASTLKSRVVGIGAVALAVSALPGLYNFGSVFDPRITDRRLGERYAWPVSRVVDKRTTWGPEALSRVAEAAGSSYPVVASDPDSSYYLSGLMPVAVVTAKGSHVPLTFPQAEVNERASDMKLVMDPTAPESLRRELLGKWRAGYVLVSPETGRRSEALSSMFAQPDLLRPVVVTPTLVLFEVRR